MQISKKAGAASAGVIACCLTFTPVWEGLWTTAQVDTIGTGRPVTYCYGQTDEFGRVKVGQKFTKEQCSAILAKSLQKYLDEISPCIKVALSDKTTASLVDAALNAGSAAVCRSPMLAKMNAGDIQNGCKSFDGWYVTTKNDGKRRVVQGLINRRSGDYRKGEKELCLEGLTDPVPTVKPARVSFWAQLLSYFRRK